MALTQLDMSCPLIFHLSPTELPGTLEHLIVSNPSHKKIIIISKTIKSDMTIHFLLKKMTTGCFLSCQLHCHSNIIADMCAKVLKIHLLVL